MNNTKDTKSAKTYWVIPYYGSHAEKVELKEGQKMFSILGVNYRTSGYTFYEDNQKNRPFIEAYNKMVDEAEALKIIMKHTLFMCIVGNKRQLRVSGLKDYIAVDLIEDFDGKTVATPFYLIPGKERKLLYRDQENQVWVETTVRVTEDFTKLECVDGSGFRWESSFDELCNPAIVRFLAK